MEERYPQAMHDKSFSELVYADDLWLIHRDISTAQFHADCIRRIGKEYGLELNDAKLEVLAINSEDSITDANGIRIEPKERILYLGVLLCVMMVELRLSLRIELVWHHAHLLICKTKKKEPCECQQGKQSRIYHACIVPKLMYGLQSCWLNQAELRRLDAFHYKCMNETYFQNTAFIY